MTIDLTVRKKCQNMLFFLARIFPYENRICESVLITEDTGQKNPYSGIFYGVIFNKHLILQTFCKQFLMFAEINQFLNNGDICFLTLGFFKDLLFMSMWMGIMDVNSTKAHSPCLIGKDLC